MTDEVCYARYTEFRVHPQNMRRFYREEDVQAMAASIQEQGILHPMIVLPNGDAKHTIVDGNFRWHGCAVLGDDAPLVPYIVRDLTEQEQAEVMATSNAMRRDPDPISEALHYQRMVRGGASVIRIARLSGHSGAHVAGRLKLLTLPQSVQVLVATGKLLIGCGLVLAEQMEDRDLQERAAQILAKNNAGISTARRLCKRLLEMGGEAPARPQPTRASTLREAVRATCAACRMGGLTRVTITWE